MKIGAVEAELFPCERTDRERWRT